MATITVRRLDDDLVDSLKLRASLNNRSLEDEARHILERAVDDDFETKRAAFLKNQINFESDRQDTIKPHRKN